MVLKELLPGQKLAQSCHACFEFAKNHPEMTKDWMIVSNYICVLEIEENKINELIEKALLQDIKISVFRESDMDNKITAVALQPGVSSKKLCNNLKLALK